MTIHTKKKSPSALQTVSSRGTSVKNKLFSNLLLTFKKIKNSHITFNELHYYIYHTNALTNEEERYKDRYFDILEIIVKTLLCTLQYGLRSTNSTRCQQ